jgi:hypothetical protein
MVQLNVCGSYIIAANVYRLCDGLDFCVPVADAKADY